MSLHVFYCENLIILGSLDHLFAIRLKNGALKVNHPILIVSISKAKSQINRKNNKKFRKYEGFKVGEEKKDSCRSLWKRRGHSETLWSERFLSRGNYTVRRKNIINRRVEGTETMKNNRMAPIVPVFPWYFHEEGRKRNAMTLIATQIFKRDVYTKSTIPL